MLKGGCEEERRGTQVEALDSLKPRKKVIILLRPQAWLGPIPLVPSTKRGGGGRVREGVKEVE